MAAPTERGLATPPAATREVDGEAPTIIVGVDKFEFAHEALLKEMHKADDLAETHSVLVVTISGASFAFAATQLDNPAVIAGVAVFGVLVGTEWSLKIVRHRQIFSAARAKLAEIERHLGIDTARPVSRLSGFNILQCLAAVFCLGWTALAAAVLLRAIPQESPSASAVIERVLREAPKLTRVPASEINVNAFSWDEPTRSYQIDLASTAARWAVTYDVAHGRIAKFGKR